MARKMAKKNKSSSTPLPGWVWMITGLFIGLFVAFLIHLKDNYPGLSLPQTSTEKQFKRDTRDVRKSQRNAIPPAPKTQYDFYTILPEMEIAVPDAELDSGKSTAFKHNSKFILQTGSFKKLSQADEMKASLALLGVQAKIQSVTINNASNKATTWHRVRLGPYDSFGEMNKIRSRLRRNRIDVLLLKLKS